MDKLWFIWVCFDFIFLVFCFVFIWCVGCICLLGLWIIGMGLGKVGLGFCIFIINLVGVEILYFWFVVLWFVEEFVLLCILEEFEIFIEWVFEFVVLVCNIFRFGFVLRWIFIYIEEVVLVVCDVLVFLFLWLFSREGRLLFI